MSNVKKAYVEIVELLEANSNKKVSTIMPLILELVSGKSNAKTFHLDDEGKVIAIYCYYHKVWELVDDVEYGQKSSTSHGLNTMCKEGVSLWTKAQRVSKKAKEELLTKVASGEVQPSDIELANEEIEIQRQVVIAQDSRLGYDTLQEALDFHNS